MARFFFDIQARGLQTHDEDGQDYPDKEAACRDALACLTQVIRERQPRLDDAEVSCEVRDTTGQIVCDVRVFTKVIWAE